MLFVHEIHRVMGLHEDEFEDEYRTVWMPRLAETDDARLLYFMRLAHGTGRAYNMITLTGVTDGAAWEPPEPALEAYRAAFEPSEQFERPHVIVAVTVICAPTDEEADFLARTMDLMWVRLQRGDVGQLPSPEEAAEYEFTPRERLIAKQYRSLAFIGSPDTVRKGIEEVAARTGADEMMVSSMIYGPRERKRSYELLAQAFGLPGRSLVMQQISWAGGSGCYSRPRPVVSPLNTFPHVRPERALNSHSQTDKAVLVLMS